MTLKTKHFIEWCWICDRSVSQLTDSHWPSSWLYWLVFVCIIYSSLVKVQYRFVYFVFHVRSKGTTSVQQTEGLLRGPETSARNRHTLRGENQRKKMYEAEDTRPLRFLSSYFLYACHPYFTWGRFFRVDSVMPFSRTQNWHINQQAKILPCPMRDENRRWE